MNQYDTKPGLFIGFEPRSVITLYGNLRKDCRYRDTTWDEVLTESTLSRIRKLGSNASDSDYRGRSEEGREAEEGRESEESKESEEGECEGGEECRRRRMWETESVKEAESLRKAGTAGKAEGLQKVGGVGWKV